MLDCSKSHCIIVIKGLLGTFADQNDSGFMLAFDDDWKSSVLVKKVVDVVSDVARL